MDPTLQIPPTSAPADLAGWVTLFSEAPLPILPDTAIALAGLDPDDDDLDAHRLVPIIHRDPFAALVVFKSVAAQGPLREFNVIETLTASAVMMGVPRMLNALREAPTLDELLREPAAREGLEQVLTRARRAADFAYDWALRRQDLDAEVISIAALLHDFSEMLLWCLRPREALAIRSLLNRHAGMRSLDAQHQILGFGLNELETELMKAWRLPELITEITSDEHEDNARVQNVRLAVATARHSAEGWHNPALPDDFEALAELLHVNLAQARHIAMSMDG